MAAHQHQVFPPLYSSSTGGIPSPSLWQQQPAAASDPVGTMMILRVAIVVGLVLLGSLTVMWLCCCCSRMVNRFMNTMCLLGVWLGIAVAIAALAMIVQFSQGIVVALGTEDGTAPTADASTIGLVLRELIKWTTSNGFTKPTLQWLAHMYSVYVPH